MTVSQLNTTKLRTLIDQSTLDNAEKMTLLRRLDLANSKAEMSELVQEFRALLERSQEDPGICKATPADVSEMGSQRVLMPGEVIPQAGIKPEAVFRKPPVKPRDTASPADTTKCPPPPPGQPIPEEADFDEDDLAALRIVGDYRFGDVLSKGPVDVSLMPEITLPIDRLRFMESLRNSISLSAEEKFRIIAALPSLSFFQLHELQRVFDDEQTRFKLLSPKHLVQLQEIEHRFLREWNHTVIYGLRVSQEKSRGQQESVSLEQRVDQDAPVSA